MNARSNTTAQLTAAAPAPEAVRTDAPYTSFSIRWPRCTLDRWGIAATLADQLIGIITADRGSGTDWNPRGDEIAAACEKVRGREYWWPTDENRLTNMVYPQIGANKACMWARMIEKVLKQDEFPLLLQTMVVAALAGVTPAVIRGLVRRSEIRVLKNDWRCLFFEPAEVEAVLRRHYNGTTMMDSVDRSLLLEPKCMVDGEEVGRLGIDSDQILDMLITGSFPSIRLGDSTVLLRSDVERFGRTAGQAEGDRKA